MIVPARRWKKTAYSAFEMLDHESISCIGCVELAIWFWSLSTCATGSTMSADFEMDIQQPIMNLIGYWSSFPKKCHNAVQWFFSLMETAGFARTAGRDVLAARRLPRSRRPRGPGRTPESAEAPHPTRNRPYVRTGSGRAAAAARPPLRPPARAARAEPLSSRPALRPTWQDGLGHGPYWSVLPG
jgi:hypothetical protein